MVMHVHCANRVTKKEFCFLRTLKAMEMDFIPSGKQVVYVLPCVQQPNIHHTPKQLLEYRQILMKVLL
jgi:hypothetical protein